jgi:hypothetical protein
VTETGPGHEPGPTHEPGPSHEPRPIPEVDTISPFALLSTGPGTVLGAAFDLLNRARSELRSASFYVGLLMLGTVGPLALLSLGAEVEYERSPAIFDTRMGGVSGWLAIAVLLAGAGAFIAVIESRAVAATLLAARLQGRPLSVRDAVRRSRMTFWRLVVATIVVNGPLLIVQGFLGAYFAQAFGGDSDLSEVSAVLAAGVIGTPFAYVTTGVVLGDVGPIEAARRSTRLFAARKASALVVSVLAILTQFINLFGLSAGIDVLARLFELLHLSPTSGGVGMALIVAIVIAAVFALGTLLFTVGALAMAPQVVMFAALTHVAPGLDRVRVPDVWDPNSLTQIRGPRFRWITWPLLGGMALGAAALVLGLSSLAR